MTVSERSQHPATASTGTGRKSAHTNTRSSAGTAKPIPITLHVYELTEGCIKAFHSGIQCGEREYSFFDGTGINHHRVKRSPVGVFKESVLLGHVDHWRVFDDVIAQLRIDFRRCDYDIVHRNCNDFTNAVCERLFNKGIPAGINRLARIARMRGIACCLPFFFGIKPRKPKQVLSTPTPISSSAPVTADVRAPKAGRHGNSATSTHSRNRNQARDVDEVIPAAFPM
eukprot:GEMP01043016.1.p1 GENE.GEMP01043016.1~~GEMP01043016.1.p1  ORF type:complete len:227 (+),score=31.14 GEMP01043016.1:117-797(+)